MWNLVFPVFTLTHCMECVWKSSLELVYFKELHSDQEHYWPTIYREGEAVSVVSTITIVNNCVWRVRLMIHCYHRRSNWWMPVLRGYIVIIIIFIHHPRRNHSQLPAQHSPHYSLRLLLSCCLLQSYLHLDFSSEDTLYGCWQLNVSWH